MSDFNLYKNEKEISHKTNRIINDYYHAENQAEQKKKRHELFHLLVLLDIKEFKDFDNYKQIKPHEPGDAIIIDENNDKHLIEIFRAFGDMENKIINKIMNNIFESNYEFEEYMGFDYDKMTKMFLDKLFEKNDKEYLKDTQYKTKNILVVTCEHNRCAICGNWVVINVANELEKRLTLTTKNYDNVYVLDYMASGEDGGPITFRLDDEIKEYKKYNLI